MGALIGRRGSLPGSTGVTESVALGADTVALFPQAELDVDAFIFERLAAEGLAGDDLGAVDRALSVYTGDLLPLDPYEDWAFHHRQRLQLRLRELLRRAGRFDQLVALDPTDEDGHVGVMRNLLRAGDRTGVIRQFELLTKVLDHELGIGPSVEACSLRDLALDPGAGPGPGSCPLPSRRGRRPSPPNRSISVRRPTGCGWPTHRAVRARRW